MILSASHSTKVLVLVATFFVGSIIVLAVFIVTLQTQLIESSALESAKLYSDALSEFRTIYTSKVVKRVKTHPDFEVTHDYDKKDYAIPLPATMSMELGRQIGEHLSGAETHLYSAYPFPWRVDSGGLNDEFRQKAWEALQANPDAPFFTFTQYKGRMVLRYAKADLMRPDCVHCHNHHPDTPKTGWAVGDVRGVLEIIHPVDVITNQHKSGMMGLYIIASLVAIFGLSGLYLLVAVNKSSSKQFLKNKKLASLGVISAKMAHEVSQPLGSALLKTQQMKRYIDGAQFDKLPKHIDKLSLCLHRIDNIITQLAAVGKTARRDNDEVFDLNDLIRSTHAEMESDFCVAEVLFNMDICEKRLYITADKTEVERVIVNLLTNALHAVVNNAAKKAVTVRTYIDKNYVVMDVIDTGYGMTDETKEKIFDAFFTTKSVGEATGLGLAMCYGIISALDGFIEVHSVLNQGSTFTIKLPIYLGEINFATTKPENLTHKPDDSGAETKQ